VLEGCSKNSGTVFSASFAAPVVGSADENSPPGCSNLYVVDARPRASRGGGDWSTETAEGDDASCSSHRMGTAIKLGGDDANPGHPLLKRIFFFNNSLRTRSPLFRGSPTPPITSYNNAVEFTGCGTLGPVPCRQQPALRIHRVLASIFGHRKAKLCSRTASP